MLSNFSFVIDGVLAGCAHPGGGGHCAEALGELRAEGIGAVVSLDETGLDGAAVAEANLDHLHLPVPDFEAPSLAQAREFVRFVRLERGKRRAVAVHCRAGCGRTGTMLACFLVAEGMNPDDAMDLVRDLRPCSIETAEQEEFVREFGEDVARGAGPAG